MYDSYLNMAPAAPVGLPLPAKRPTRCRLSAPAACHSLDRAGRRFGGANHKRDSSTRYHVQSRRRLQASQVLTYATRFSELGSHWSKKSSASAEVRQNNREQNLAVVNVVVSRYKRHLRTAVTYRLSVPAANRSAFV